MPDMTILVPTRGRPTNYARLAAACANTLQGDTHLIGILDNDDPTIDDYLNLPGRMTYSILPARTGIGMVTPLNTIATNAAHSSYAICVLGDDVLPRTPGWDTMLLDALHARRTGIAYGDDLVWGPRLPTHAAITSDIINLLGWAALPTLWHLYVDNTWQTLGTLIDRLTYCPHVVLEHLHPINGKAPWGQRYAEVNDPAVLAHDRAAYLHWATGQAEDDARKIIDVLGLDLQLSTGGTTPRG